MRHQIVGKRQQEGDRLRAEGLAENLIQTESSGQPVPLFHHHRRGRMQILQLVDNVSRFLLMRNPEPTL